MIPPDTAPESAAPRVRPSWHQDFAFGAILVGVRLAATFWVRSTGFSAVSDDDYARIAIAESVARSPTLDPTGTSWLPLPFWVNGAAMALFGRSIAVAIAVSTIAACLSGVVVYAGARVAGVGARSAFFAVLAGSLMPVVLLTGAATVPELPAAALTAALLLLLRRPEARYRWAACGLALPATLCRYESWPAAAAVAVFCLTPRAPTTDRNAEHDRLSFRTRVGCAALALLGPLAWIAWNAVTHGDPFHFHVRVASYRQALGAATGSVLASYAHALLTDGAPLVAIAIVALAMRASRRAMRRSALPLIGCAFVLAALLIADFAGGAPTHHPERSLLSVWLVGWIVVVDGLADTMAKLRPAVSASVAGVVCALIIALSVEHVLSVRSSYGVDRSYEVRTGSWLRANVADTDRVLVDPHDFGYFAIVAAFGVPERVKLSRSIDPRHARVPSGFESEQALRARVASDGIRWLVVKDHNATAALMLGELRARFGEWEIVRVR